MKDIRRVLYNLKKRFSTVITVRKQDGYTFNTKTGVKTWSTNSSFQLKAIVLDGMLLREHSLLSLPQFANFGGEVNQTRRLIIIDAKDYSEAFEMDKFYFICDVGGVLTRFNIKSLDYYSIMEAWLIKVERGGEQINNVINISVIDHLDTDDTIGLIGSTGPA